MTVQERKNCNTLAELNILEDEKVRPAPDPVRVPQEWKVVCVIEDSHDHHIWLR